MSWTEKRPSIPIWQCNRLSCLDCRPHHVARKVLKRSIVRFKLLEAALARRMFQSLRTNSPRRLLYAGPTILVAPGLGTSSSRRPVFLLRRARATRNSFGCGIVSVSRGMRLNGIASKSATPLRSAIIHDSTSMTATRRKKCGCCIPLIHDWINCGGHGLGAS